MYLCTKGPSLETPSADIPTSAGFAVGSAWPSAAAVKPRTAVNVKEKQEFTKGERPLFYA